MYEDCLNLLNVSLLQKVNLKPNIYEKQYLRIKSNKTMNSEGKLDFGSMFKNDEEISSVSSLNGNL